MNPWKITARGSQAASSRISGSKARHAVQYNGPSGASGQVELRAQGGELGFAGDRTGEVESGFADGLHLGGFVPDTLRPGGLVPDNSLSDMTRPGGLVPDNSLSDTPRPGGCFPGNSGSDASALVGEPGGKGLYILRISLPGMYARGAEFDSAARGTVGMYIYIRKHR